MRQHRQQHTWWQARPTRGDITRAGHRPWGWARTRCHVWWGEENWGHQTSTWLKTQNSQQLKSPDCIDILPIILHLKIHSNIHSTFDIIYFSQPKNFPTGTCPRTPARCVLWASLTWGPLHPDLAPPRTQLDARSTLLPRRELMSPYPAPRRDSVFPTNPGSDMSRISHRREVSGDGQVMRSECLLYITFPFVQRRPLV